MVTAKEGAILDMYATYFTLWEISDPSLADTEIDALAGFSMAQGGAYDQVIQTSGLPEERIAELEAIAWQRVEAAKDGK